MSRTRGRYGRTALSDHSRPSRELPDQPSLRYLKIEARERLAGGEFASLHEAQLAIAREHGRTSWAALKTAIEAAAPDSSPALDQVRWFTARFAGADDPAWTAPGEAELREHFDDQYLALMPPATMVSALRPVAARLRGELIVTQVAAYGVRAQIAGLRVEAAAEPDPPHRLTRLRMYPVAGQVADPRVASPTTRVSGEPPAGAAEVAEESLSELGLVGLVLAGGDQDRPAPWAVERGWADLDRPEELSSRHRFAAYGVTKLITSTAVLRLVAEGRVDLDRPANAYLSTLRLSDDSVTVRALLTHTGGVASAPQMFADRVPGDLTALLGPTVPCDRPGAFVPSNGGYAVLGQLIADITGSPYPDAVAGLVLRPLGMDESWFPDRWPDANAVTGYQLPEDGSFEQAPRQVCTLQAAGGLWATAGDLVRFGLGWSSLLPGPLSAEAVRPQAAQRAQGAEIGLAWLVSPAKDIYGHAGVGPGAAVSLMIRSGSGVVTVACTNRQLPLEPVNARLIRPIA